MSSNGQVKYISTTKVMYLKAYLHRLWDWLDMIRKFRKVT